MGEREAHQRVAGLEQRVVDGGVGLRAGVRLDVGVLGPEQLLGAVDRELLGDVDVLAAAVVALARVALGVLVGQHRALALEHRLRHEVLRGDHLERALLALELEAQHLGDLGIDLGERAVEEVGRQLAGAHAYPTVSAGWRSLAASPRAGPRGQPTASPAATAPPAAPSHRPLAVRLVARRSTTVDGVPGSSPPSSTRSAARRSNSGHIVQAPRVRAAGAVGARLQHRPAHAGQRGQDRHAHPSVPDRLRTPGETAAPGWGAAPSAPGQQPPSAAAREGRAPGTARARARGRRTSPPTACSNGRPLSR